MEFLNGIFIEVSGHKLESSQIRVFDWFFILIFPFYEMLTWIDSSFLVSHIFWKDF